MILIGWGTSTGGSGSMVISNRRLGGKNFISCDRSSIICGRTNSGMGLRLVTLPLLRISGVSFAPGIFLAMIFLPQFMCQKFGRGPCDWRVIRLTSKIRRSPAGACGQAMVLMWRRPLGDLHQVIGAKPAGKGVLDVLGVQFDVNMRGSNRLIQRQVEHGTREPAADDGIHA